MLMTDRLEFEIAFYGAEIDLFRAGREAYLAMLALTATNKLEAAGGIGPFEFSCRGADGNVSPYVFKATEL